MLRASTYRTDIILKNTFIGVFGYWDQMETLVLKYIEKITRDMSKSVLNSTEERMVIQISNSFVIQVKIYYPQDQLL